MTAETRERQDVVLDVQGLRTYFTTDDTVVRAVDGVDLAVRRGSTLCVVGESGCGKSAMARSVLQLVERPGRVVDGRVLLHPAGGGGEPVDLAALHPTGKEIRSVRGREVAMVFQEPMASLSLVHTVGDQIGEPLRLHHGLSRKEARTRAVELLERVRVPGAERVVDSYPFQLSGGMCQRVMIAMALACGPRVLIADEPTTALDVTTQAQILDLFAGLRRDTGMGLLFITHDMGVVAEIADEVAVMYLGTVVEQGPVDEIFHDPRHPYTRALLEAVPRIGASRARRLPTIRGTIPDPGNQPTGCVFRTRCPEAVEGLCDTTVPPVTAPGPGRRVRCLLDEGSAPGGAPDGGDAVPTGKETVDAD
ncbi:MULTISPECIES: ABC transporter ATP-binding protein [Nocardiopsis]|uniref:Dipeptide/oligopeptide/nickel ABC transporter ATP-binding protein n=1 Tax=Nocardiopsis sinuspersici TaxID=501010 RepID=A0A1V3C6C1_9ACTN|nr:MULTISPECIES: ABC transporter ATP-binding protein [Nocardiopsis]OOC56076.1 dipeptide/oligopeptide/nickel ABC transporter ATP-binding protein [Nocardiopsis sinuspersici]